jgi:phage protein D
VIGTKAADVRSVTYTCGGRTYPATISGDVVTFVAQSSSLRADDCTENVTLAGGAVVSKRV